MADFLSRLAARTLGVAAVARPTIPPVFSPSAQVAVEHVSAAPRSHVEANLDPPEATVRAAAPRPAVQKLEQPQETLPVSWPRRETRLDAADMSVRATPAPPSVERFEEVVVRQESPSQAAMPTEAVVKVEAERVPMSNQAVSYPPVPDRRGSEAATEPQQLPNGWYEDGLTSSRLRIENRVIWPSLPPKVAQPAKRQESEPEDSTVEVSIGRVEVRAIFPEARPAPVLRPPAQAALSLADYLKERDRGAR
jgi:hypothetical protein